MRPSAVLLASSVILAAAAAFFVAAPAKAFFADSRPAQACAPMADDMSLPGLWLGHFSGGRLIRGPDDARTLAWRDAYSCFDTARACAAWQRSLKRRYADQQGYVTCTPLRGGGTPILTENVIRAKY